MNVFLCTAFGYMATIGGAHAKIYSQYYEVESVEFVRNIECNAARPRVAESAMAQRPLSAICTVLVASGAKATPGSPNYRAGVQSECGGDEALCNVPTPDVGPRTGQAEMVVAPYEVHLGNLIFVGTVTDDRDALSECANCYDG